MTYSDLPLYKATWSGTIGTEEIFSYSRHVVDGEGGGLAAILGQLSTSVTDMLATDVTGGGTIAGLDELFPTHVVWTNLKLAQINPATGKYTSQDDVVEMALSDHGVATSAEGLPFQNAIAVTTRSDHSKDQTSRNRFYLPTPAYRGTDGQGRLRQAVADAIVLWMALGQTSAIADTNSYAFCNYSPKLHAAFPIEDVYLGDRIDTISRRRNHAVETRTVDTLDVPFYA